MVLEPREDQAGPKINMSDPYIKHLKKKYILEVEVVYCLLPSHFLFLEQAEEEVELQVFGQDQEEDDDKQAEQRDHLLLLGFEEEEEVEVQECY